MDCTEFLQIPDYEAFIHEMAQCLRPGGPLVFLLGIQDLNFRRRRGFTSRGGFSNVE